MTIELVGTYLNDIDTADGSILKTDLDTIVDFCNTHAAAATLDHPSSSVTSAKIADGAIIAAKLASSSVETAKIANEAVTQEKLTIGRNYVTDVETAILSGALTADPTSADGSVCTDTVNLGSGSYAGMILVFTSGTASGLRYNISSNDTTAKTVTLKTAANGGGNAYTAGARSADTFKIVDTPIRKVHIGDNEIITAHIKDDAVTNAKLANNAVNTDQIVDDAVTIAKISGGIPMVLLNYGGSVQSGTITETTVPLSISHSSVHPAASWGAYVRIPTWATKIYVAVMGGATYGFVEGTVTVDGHTTSEITIGANTWSGNYEITGFGTGSKAWTINFKTYVNSDCKGILMWCE